MAAKIFISYRRDDSLYAAGRIHDRLANEFGQDLLFMDVDAIPLGSNFPKILREEVAKCDILLAVIGQRWLGTADGSGQRRLDFSDDFVRIEIATALSRDILVIPILLEGARIPKAEDLPADLRELSARNALDVRGASFHSDMNRLITFLKRGYAASEQKAPNPPPVSSASSDEGRDGWLSALLNRADTGSSDRDVPRGRPQQAADGNPPEPLSSDIGHLMNRSLANEMWNRYERGESKAFTKQLYTSAGQKAFDEVSRKYRTDQNFTQTVDRYLIEFERLLEELARDEHGPATARSYLASETGLVYTMLAHAAGRFDNSST